VDFDAVAAGELGGLAEVTFRSGYGEDACALLRERHRDRAADAAARARDDRPPACEIKHV
jgi:hypothetical protein